MKYYFITWSTLDNENFSKGTKVLSFSEDINLYFAHKQISKTEAENKPVMIESWKEITKEQTIQFDEYVQEVLKSKSTGKILSLVKNENT